MKNNTELKEFDCVERIADRARYRKEGVYKGMQGWICYAKEGSCKRNKYLHLLEQKKIS